MFTGGAALGTGILFFFVLNIVLIVVTSITAPFTDRQYSEECTITTEYRNQQKVESLPTWACGTILADIGEQIVRGFGGGFTATIGAIFKVLGGAFSLLLGFFTLDYDLLKGEDAVSGFVGWIIRIVAWVIGLFMLYRATLGFFGRG